MAGRKSIGTFDKKIEKLKTAIEKKEDEIKRLKAQIKDLEEEKKQKELEDLRELISASGKTISEVKELIVGK